MKTITVQAATTPDNITRQILQALKSGNILIKSTSKWKEEVDGEIVLGDTHKDISIQVGEGYYVVGKSFGKGNGFYIRSWEGKGNLIEELTIANNARK